MSDRVLRAARARRLMGIALQAGDPFDALLDALFGFMRRRTDFFHTEAIDDARSKVSRVFNKHKKKQALQEKRNKAPKQVKDKDMSRPQITPFLPLVAYEKAVRAQKVENPTVVFWSTRTRARVTLSGDVTDPAVLNAAGLYAGE